MERRDPASILSTQSDDSFAPEDLWTYQKIGEKGTALTGYPAMSVYHEFRYHPKEVITGVFDDWLFDHMGIFAWTVELWSPQRQAGITEYKYIDWFREHPVEDDLKMLKWSDEVLDRKGYVDWYPFDHPALGKVELGGWDHLYAWRNPPPQFLEKEIAPFADWLIWHLLIAPRLEIYEVAGHGARSQHLSSAADRPEHGLAAELCFQECAGEKAGARRDRRDRTAGRRFAENGQAPRRTEPA